MFVYVFVRFVRDVLCGVVKFVCVSVKLWCLCVCCDLNVLVWFVCDLFCAMLCGLCLCVVCVLCVFALSVFVCFVCEILGGVGCVFVDVFVCVRAISSFLKKRCLWVLSVVHCVCFVCVLCVHVECLCDVCVCVCFIYIRNVFVRSDCDVLCDSVCCCVAFLCLCVCV